MASRKQRYFGCFGVVFALAILLLAVNFTLSLYYRHKSDLIGREMAKRGSTVVVTGQI